MERALLERGNFGALIAAMGKSAAVFAPSGEGGSLPSFRPVSSEAEIILKQPNTRLSVKGVFFPQRELLMGFDGSSLVETPPGAAGAIVVFAARPCDARSLTWLDGIFGGEAPGPGAAVYRDPYYMERRKNSLIVSLACDEPCGSCFCTSVGGSPYGTDGADVLASMTDKNGDAPLLLEAATAKGRDFLEAHRALLSPAGDGDVRAREERARVASAGMAALDLSGVKEKADAAFDSPVWEAITRSCLGCGACTYLCPTCHCFDITDETVGTRGARVRSWDSCQFPLFTLHASGHNPRPARAARMRQRVMHKYSYAVETAGATYCSGCGRCVRYCPVNLDIRQMLAALKETP